MSRDTEDTMQLSAFMVVVIAVVLVTLAPVIVTGLMGKVVPDSLIAVSDKCITGLVGVLGTLAGVKWGSRVRGASPDGTPADPVSVRETDA